jgi:hypothetical protein
MKTRKEVISTTIYTVYGKEITASVVKLTPEGWLYAHTEWEELWIPPNNVKHVSTKWGVVDHEDFDE